MVIVIVCGLLLLGGLFAALRWSGLPVTSPDQAELSGRTGVSEAVRRYLWWLALTAVAGLGSGLLVAGAGGRLIMRLLAVTSPEARGQITEANQTIGRISLDGTMELIVFSGFFAGLLSAVLYLLIRRWLPSARLGALTFGLLLSWCSARGSSPCGQTTSTSSWLGHPGWPS